MLRRHLSLLPSFVLVLVIGPHLYCHCFTQTQTHTHTRTPIRRPAIGRRANMGTRAHTYAQTQTEGIHSHVQCACILSLCVHIRCQACTAAGGSSSTTCTRKRSLALPCKYVCGALVFSHSHKALESVNVMNVCVCVCVQAYSLVGIKNDYWHWRPEIGMCVHLSCLRLCVWVSVLTVCAGGERRELPIRYQFLQCESEGQREGLYGRLCVFLSIICTRVVCVSAGVPSIICVHGFGGNCDHW